MTTDLLTVLDMVADGLAKDRPDLSEAEVALSTIRLNLTVLAQTLAEIGVTGEGLSNDALYGICNGIVDTCAWIIAKEMVDETMPEIENELG